MTVRYHDGFDLMGFAQVPIVMMNELELCAAGTEKVGRVLAGD